MPLTHMAGHCDIFLSYSREDLPAARHYAAGFEREGFSVWWDQNLDAGEAFDNVTEKSLENARAVVVLWSTHSVQSRWVRAEATQADRLKKLVPVEIEPCRRPIMFELTQTAELAHWRGDVTDGAWLAFVAGLRRFVGKDAQPAKDIPAKPPGRSRLHLGLVLGAMLAVGLVAGALWKLRGDAAAVAQVAASPGPAVTESPSIAVLPFVNMSSDPEQQFFADGLSEELLNQLAQVPGLRVIGRTSSFAYKGRNEDLRQIGETLGVNHILEGSVRRSGNQLRITAQLIDPADGSHLWSETYDRALENVFAIQDEIARSVSERMQLTIAGAGDGSSAGGTRNVAAYEEYLLGISKLRALRPDSVMQSVQHLERAVEMDPGFEAAWGALLGAYSAVVNTVPEQRAAAQRRRSEIMELVLKSAPDSAVATGVRAVRASQAKDYATALALRRDLLEVGLPSGLSYGALLLVLGRPSAAAEVFAEGRQKDPLVGLYTVYKMIAHETAGQNVLAEEEYQRALASSNVPASLLEGSALVRAMGQNDRPAIDRLLPRAIASGPDQSAVNGAALKFLDEPQAAVRELRRLMGEPAIQADLFSMAALSQWAAYFGDDALALEALLRTSRGGTNVEAWGFSLWRPINRSVRRLPGFKALLSEQGFVDYWRKSGTWNEFCQPAGAEDFECR